MVKDFQVVDNFRDNYMHKLILKNTYKSISLIVIAITILTCMSTLIMHSKTKKITCFEIKGKIKCVKIIKFI